MADKRYYWLKLHKDFFKRHEIRIIEDMPNGKDYILFYLKMLVESVTHNGELRFSDTIPYNEQMLATITHTNIDIVKAAMQIFIELNMIEILDDQTIYMAEVETMIGSETAEAQRKRIQRASQKAIADNVGTMSGQCPTENRYKRIDIRDKNKRESIERKPPTLDEVKEYVRLNSLNVDAETFVAYYASQNWKKANGRPLEDWKAACRYWSRTEKSKGLKRPATYDLDQAKRNAENNTNI